MRWLTFARVSSQRIGSLLAVVASGSDSRPTNLEGITRLYEPTLRHPVVIPPERAIHVHEYLNRQHLWERYRSLKKTDAAAIAGSEIQIQDLWLSDPSLPSASGAITDRVLDEPPQLAAALRLVRGENYTLTDRGKAFRLAGETEVTSIREKNIDTNPFLLSSTSRLFSLWTFLEEDFDFLRASYAIQLDSLGSTFTRMDFAMRLDEACDQLRQAWVRRVRTGKDRERLVRLAEIQEKIRDIRAEKDSGQLATWGGGRTPDQLATIRLEPLVDIGLLGRARFDYDYTISDAQRTFFTEMIDSESANEFLDHRLFHAFLTAMEVEPTPIGKDEIWSRIKIAHAAVRSRLGYASFKEVVVLAMSVMANERLGPCFELQDGIDVIQEQQKEQPRAVRFGVTRGGGLTYIKIAESAKGA